MPNIELHGFGGQYVINNMTVDLPRVIFAMFQTKPYVSEMVVTVYPTTVIDQDGVNQPFIRLVNSCQEHSEEILKRLKELRVDIEHVRLEGFHPKP